MSSSNPSVWVLTINDQPPSVHLTEAAAQAALYAHVKAEWNDNVNVDEEGECPADPEQAISEYSELNKNFGAEIAEGEMKSRTTIPPYPTIAPRTFRLSLCITMVSKADDKSITQALETIVKDADFLTALSYEGVGGEVTQYTYEVALGKD